MNPFFPKILTPTEARAERDKLHAAGRKRVFTNGCFDIPLHGHLTYTAFARAQADALCVGLNTDASVRRAKGPRCSRNGAADSNLSTTSRPVHLALRSISSHGCNGSELARSNSSWVRRAAQMPRKKICVSQTFHCGTDENRDWAPAY